MPTRQRKKIVKKWWINCEPLDLFLAVIIPGLDGRRIPETEMKDSIRYNAEKLKNAWPDWTIQYQKMFLDCLSDDAKTEFKKLVIKNYQKSINT